MECLHATVARNSSSMKARVFIPWARQRVKPGGWLNPTVVIGGSYVHNADLPMIELSAKIVITNGRQSSQVVYIEPWGEDYTLLAGESLDVIALGRVIAPWFNVVESDNNIQVYIEGDSTEFAVYQGGLRVRCGHNRGL